MLLPKKVKHRKWHRLGKRHTGVATRLNTVAFGQFGVMSEDHAWVSSRQIEAARRVNGVEIARTESLATGKVPLITLRSDVDYASVTAHTLYGAIGIKVWIYNGEVFGRKDKFAESATANEKSKE